jgi:hypothetical protein
LGEWDRKMLEQTRMHQVRFNQALVRTLEALRKVRREFGETGPADPEPGAGPLLILGEGGLPSCDPGPIDLEPAADLAAPVATNEAISTEVVPSGGAGVPPACPQDGGRDAGATIGPPVQDRPNPGADPENVTNEANRPSASAAGLVGAILAMLALLFLAGRSAAFAHGEARGYAAGPARIQTRRDGHLERAPRPGGSMAIRGRGADAAVSVGQGVGVLQIARHVLR